MQLADTDKRMLDGDHGPAAQQAMAHLVKLGEAFEADTMVDVHSVHLFSDWLLMNEAGLQLYQRFVGLGAKMRVHSSCEPIGFDLSRGGEFKLPPEYYTKQMELIRCLRSMDVVLTFSNLIHLTQNCPKLGDNIAWIEGNATGWANSVAGARGNRESPINSLMAGITGRLPRYGLLREENRRAQVIIEIDPAIIDSFGKPGSASCDWSSLGMLVGDLAFDKIPAVVGLPKHMKIEELKAFCSMCSPALTTTLILMVGISPEAPTLEAAFGGRVPDHVERKRVTLEQLKDGYASMSQAPTTHIDGVLTGCPYKTIYELQELADLLEGKRIRDGLFFWIYTDQAIWTLAESSGLRERIERSGARLYHDACPVMIPHDRLFGPDKVFAADSVKMVRLIRGIGKPNFLFGPLPDLIDAAVTGEFVSTRW
jgi:cis-L-3-hydroxyproline dehydratase